ncbi:cupin domain-containing protein [Kaustia mangrovi]|uniref:Cupin domain-containing protein n=1 Tax=Kaustia mangrovi TaxID=2593653 RepID=A0A7S8HBL7_9HYPH|nr:cupin domain-containing protein [Kaustia mangrovi]QPC42631.1 cupin domain-containing protein [Kaustia mangrovi]
MRLTPPSPIATARPEASQDEDRALGRAIRDIRQARGLSLKDVADGAGVSVGLLSQIERGLSSPSIRALRAVCAVLDVPVHALFESPAAVIEEDSRRIVRAGDRRSLDFGAKAMVKELLTPDEEGALQVMEVILGPGGGSGEEPYSHEGEEAGVVLRGRMELYVDGTTYRLGEGDAFRFESTLPHMFRNAARSTTRVLWIVTPPVY